MSGKLVVAPSRTAPTAPIVALAVTSANVARPASDSASGPTCTAGPPRTNGTKAATNTTSGRITRTRAQTVPGLTLATAATTASATAHAAKAGHARNGVETATTVIPASPTIFARGSSRWIRLAVSPATPV